MPSLRKIKKLFGRDSTAHIHPRRKDDELVVCHRMEKILRDRNVTSHPFRVKYIGCTLIVSPTLSPEKADEVARTIIQGGPRSNKRRVSVIFTPEEIFVNDTIYRCGLASFPMQEIGMVYAPAENRELFGITVKDTATSGYTFYLYKCSVRDFDCENVQMRREYEKMYEDYIKTQEAVYETIHSPEVTDAQEELIPYFEKLRNAQQVQPSDLLILNKSLHTKTKKADKVPLSISTTLSDPDIQSADFTHCTCPKSRQHQRRNAVISLEEIEFTDGPRSCRFHGKQVRPKRPVRRTIMARLLECAPLTDVKSQTHYSDLDDRLTCHQDEQQQLQTTVTLDSPSLSCNSASTSTAAPSFPRSHHLLPFPTTARVFLPTLKLSFPPTPPTTAKDSTASFVFCHSTYTMKLVYSFIAGTILSLSGFKLQFSPCSLVLSPIIPPHSYALPTTATATSSLSTSTTAITTTTATNTPTSSSTPPTSYPTTSATTTTCTTTAIYSSQPTATVSTIGCVSTASNHSTVPLHDTNSSLSSVFPAASNLHTSTILASAADTLADTVPTTHSLTDTATCPHIPVPSTASESVISIHSSLTAAPVISHTAAVPTCTTAPTSSANSITAQLTDSPNTTATLLSPNHLSDSSALMTTATLTSSLSTTNTDCIAATNTHTLSLTDCTTSRTSSVPSTTCTTAIGALMSSSPSCTVLSIEYDSTPSSLPTVPSHNTNSSLSSVSPAASNFHTSTIPASAVSLATTDTMTPAITTTQYPTNTITCPSTIALGAISDSTHSSLTASPITTAAVFSAPSSSTSELTSSTHSITGQLIDSPDTSATPITTDTASFDSSSESSPPVTTLPDSKGLSITHSSITTVPSMPTFTPLSVDSATPVPTTALPPLTSSPTCTVLSIEYDSTPSSLPTVPSHNTNSSLSSVSPAASNFHTSTIPASAVSLATTDTTTPTIPTTHSLTNTTTCPSTITSGANSNSLISTHSSLTASPVTAAYSVPGFATELTSSTHSAQLIDSPSDTPATPITTDTASFDPSPESSPPATTSSDSKSLSVIHSSVTTVPSMPTFTAPSVDSATPVPATALPPITLCTVGSCGTLATTPSHSLTSSAATSKTSIVTFATKPSIKHFPRHDFTTPNTDATTTSSTMSHVTSFPAAASDHATVWALPTASASSSTLTLPTKHSSISPQVSSLQSFSSSSHASKTNTLPPNYGPGINEGTTTSVRALYDTIPDELEYWYSDLNLHHSPSPCILCSSSCSVDSLVAVTSLYDTSNSRAVEHTHHTASTPVMHKVPKQQPSRHSHSLPNMSVSPTQQWPSPLLQNVLSALFIFARGPNSLAPTDPDSLGLAERESVWTSAARLTSHIDLSSSSGTEDDEEEMEIEEGDSNESEETDEESDGYTDDDDDDMFCSSRSQTPRKRITPFIMSRIREIDASVEEPRKSRIHPKILEVVEKLENKNALLVETSS